MKKIPFLLISLLLCVYAIHTRAQDAHLSQYFHAPTFMNPSTIGNFEGGLRVQGNYRNQWSSVTTPYKTTFASADWSVSNFGIGLVFVNDGAGAAGLTHTGGLVGLSYRREVIPNHSIALGIQGGFIQKHFDPENFQFDSQYNPDLGFDPTISSGEVFSTTKIFAGDFHAGGQYEYKSDIPRTVMGAKLGFSFAHLNQIHLSFLDEAGMNIPRKLTVQAELDFLAGKRLRARPMFLYVTQGTAKEMNGGLVLDYKCDDEVFLHIGGHYRFDDAVIPYAGITFNKMHLGLSYDVNVSRLSPFSHLRGGYELSLRYIFGSTNPKIKTPKNDLARKGKALKDMDGDGVRDARDACPDEIGLAKFGGCPDTDGDGIADKDDECPMNPGTAKTRGCPLMDRDQDGVMDPVDVCPDLPGLAQYRGCPDTDQDGMPDNLDKCPQTPGPKERAGCPNSDIDADGDGIPDKIDACPTIPGEVRLQGCPEVVQQPQYQQPQVQYQQPVYRPQQPQMQGLDSDRDGIPDINDRCPSIFGIFQLQGCPDSDGDGISDFEDSCPMIAGEIANKGCPNQNFDADGDGIPNMTDQCPYVPGLPNFMGCPDTDKDGLSDLQDRCPLIAGPVNNQGCPLQQAMNTYPPAQSQARPFQYQAQQGFPEFGPVEFDVDKAIVKEKYFAMLNELGDYMMTNPDIKLMIVGHTDDQGDPMYNMVLGDNRSKAITYILRIRGIEMNRITSLSYGEQTPKTENNTEYGKARNRRAELILTR